jgi:hypothetical protein
MSLSAALILIGKDENDSTQRMTQGDLPERSLSVHRWCMYTAMSLWRLSSCPAAGGRTESCWHAEDDGGIGVDEGLDVISLAMLSDDLSEERLRKDAFASLDTGVRTAGGIARSASPLSGKNLLYQSDVYFLSITTSHAIPPKAVRSMIESTSVLEVDAGCCRMSYLLSLNFFLDWWFS